jgi:NADPH:quinone reductase-like Zn-dependent oxidoreductase/NADP-dependent 3-hydroxy acid dehydrogenase YdfG
LAAAGLQVRTIHANPDESYDQLLAETLLDRRTLIVFAAGLRQRATSWSGLAACPAVPSLLQLTQTLLKRGGVPRLCLVTNGTAGLPSEDHLDLSQAILHGMSRVIRNECPQVPLTVIDLSRSISSSEVDALVFELLHTRRDRDESEIALRGEDRFMRMLIPVDRDSAEQAATSDEAGFGGAFRAELNEAGVLDQVGFRRLPPNDPGDDDVEIAVRAAGLTFKDLMNAMGMLPLNAVMGGLTGHRLGMEVAGHVLRVGSRVKHVQPGDEVIARVSEGFCGRLITRGDRVVLKPPRLTPGQAAAIPVAYITAWYSLSHLARMTKGETVLIHSGSGGVGGAAIQLAQRAGATVIATAGTKEKRAYLRQIGVEHVFDSRSLNFTNQVMEVTNGRGVDIVLNSLTGRFVTQSAKCLAPFGRFLELGKSDVYRNSKLSLERFAENISYFVVDVDRLATQKPELHRQVLTQVVEMFERGELQSHPITEFPISKLQEAMKFMHRSAYCGKIVLNMEHDRVMALPPRQAAFRADRSYLISAGASGFGLEIARWMLGRGARNFVLLSRTGPKTDADRESIEWMMEQGARVLLAQADITDADAVRRLLGRIQRELPPLAGVIHGAAVMDDASIPAMTMARFERVFGPKAQGAWNLHEATVESGVKLDFFVLLSSISSVLGFVGQVNYAASNFFQDALAQYRRQQGLPATAVNLGVLGQYAGLSRTVNETQDVIGLLESQGLLVMPLSDILGKLEAALIQQPVQRMTGRFDWSQFRMAYPHLVRDVRFVDLLSDSALAKGNRPKSSSLRAELSELEPDQRRQRLESE